MLDDPVFLSAERGLEAHAVTSTTTTTTSMASVEDLIKHKTRQTHSPSMTPFAAPHEVPLPEAAAELPSAAVAPVSAAAIERIMDFKTQSDDLKNAYELREKQLRSQLALEKQKLMMDVRVLRESLEMERSRRQEAASDTARLEEESRTSATQERLHAEQLTQQLREQHAEEIAALTRENRELHTRTTSLIKESRDVTSTQDTKRSQKLQQQEEAIRTASSALHAQSEYIKDLEEKNDDLQRRLHDAATAATGSERDMERAGVLEARVLSLTSQVEARDKELSATRTAKEQEISQLENMLKQESQRASKAVREQIQTVNEVETAASGEVKELQSIVQELLVQQKQRETLCDELKTQLSKTEEELSVTRSHVVHQTTSRTVHTTPPPKDNNFFAISPSSRESSPDNIPRPAHTSPRAASVSFNMPDTRHASEELEAQQSIWHEERMRLEREVREKTAAYASLKSGHEAIIEQLQRRLSIDEEARGEERRCWKSRIDNLEGALAKLTEQRTSPQSVRAASPPPPPPPPRDTSPRAATSDILRSPNMSQISVHHDPLPAHESPDKEEAGETSQAFEHDILARIESHLQRMVSTRDETEEARLKRELEEKREQMTHLTRKYKAAKGKLVKESKEREGLSKEVSQLSILMESHKRDTSYRTPSTGRASRSSSQQPLRSAAKNPRRCPWSQK